MGSWNKTCSLSNLHIFAGTPVYVFVLEDVSAERDNDCYTTSLFSPLLLPFNSEYNDYGGGENSGGPGFERIMNAIKESLIEVGVGDNEYHDIAVKRDAFNEELFFDAVHKNRLKIKGWRGKPVNLSFTMFRRDIVDDILQNHTFEEYVGHGAGNCGYNNNYVRVGYQDYVADIRPMLDHIVSEINDFRSSGVNEKTERALFRSISMFERDDNRASQLLSSIDYRYSRLVDFRSIGYQLLDDSSEANIQHLTALITEYFKGVYIDKFMHAARKTWIPGGHEGSQSTSGDELRFLYAATVRALDREDKEFGEEDEDFICPKCGLENPTTTCGLNDCGLITGV